LFGFGTTELIAIALLLAGPIALLAPAFAAGQVFLPMHPVAFPPLDRHADREFLALARRAENRDVVDKVLPILTDGRLFARQVRAGEVPLWDPYNGGGAPLLGQILAGSLYPPNLLQVAMGPERAYAPLAVLTLFLAGAFTFGFLRARGLGGVAALAGGIAFAGSGYALANLHYYMKVDAVVWLPAGLLAIERARARPGPLPLAALAVAVAMSALAGFPQVTAFVAYALAAYALARLLPPSAGAPARRALGLLGVGAAAALGLGLAAVQLVPAVEASRESLRNVQSLESFTSGGLPPAAALRFVLPRSFGSPDDLVPPRPPLFGSLSAQPLVWLLADPREGLNLTESALYLGIPALGLAALGLLRRGGGRGFAAGGALLALLYVFASPLLLPLYHLPGLRIGAPPRAGALFAFFAAWLVALGTEALFEPGSRRRTRNLGAAILGLAASAFLAAVLTSPERFRASATPAIVDRWEAQARGTPFEPFTAASLASAIPAETMDVAAHRLRVDLFRLGALGAATALAFLFAGSERRRCLAAGALLSLLAVDLGSFGRPLLEPRPAGDLFPQPPPVRALREAAGLHRVIRLDPVPELGDVFHLLRSNLPAEYAIQDVSGYMAFAPRRPVELFHALDPQTRFRGRYLARLPREDLVDHPLLDVAGIGVVLSTRPLRNPGLEETYGEESFHVNRRARRLPRAWIVPRALAVPDEEALSRLADPAFSPADLVLLSEGSSAERPGGGTVEIARYEPGRVEIEVRGTGGGFLVLSDPYYPGWRATVDGAPALIRRANYAYRAVDLAPGDHRVVVEYRPASFRTGLFLTSLSGAILVAMAAIGARRRRA
jgi:hypothetical protein